MEKFNWCAYGQVNNNEIIGEKLNFVNADMKQIVPNVIAAIVCSLRIQN